MYIVVGEVELQVSYLLNQHFPDLIVATGSRLHQRSQTGLCPVLHVSSMLTQQAHHFMATLETGQGEGRVSIGLNLKEAGSSYCS